VCPRKNKQGLFLHARGSSCGQILEARWRFVARLARKRVESHDSHEETTRQTASRVSVRHATKRAGITRSGSTFAGKRRTVGSTVRGQRKRGASGLVVCPGKRPKASLFVGLETTPRHVKHGRKWRQARTPAALARDAAAHRLLRRPCPSNFLELAAEGRPHTCTS